MAPKAAPKATKGGRKAAERAAAEQAEAERAAAAAAAHAASSQPVPVKQEAPDPKEMLSLENRLKYMASKGNAGPLKSFRAQGLEERIRFYHEDFALDRKLSKHQVAVHNSSERTDKVEVEKGWFTDVSVAEKKGLLNLDPSTAGLVRYRELVAAAVAGLKSRPHEDEALANLDVQQYYWEKATVTEAQASKKRVQFTEQAEVAADDYAEALTSLGQGGKKAKVLGNNKSLPAPTPVPPTPAEAEWAKSKAAAKTLLRDSQNKCQDARLLLLQLEAKTGPVPAAYRAELTEKLKTYEKALVQYETIYAACVDAGLKKVADLELAVKSQMSHKKHFSTFMEPIVKMLK